MQYDVNKIREDFPILARSVYGKPLVYLDNGATTQKPRCVVESITDEYYSVNANVHRGVHFLSISCLNRQRICMRLHVRRYVGLLMHGAFRRLSLLVERPRALT